MDGDTFRVEHPDFAFVDPSNTEVIIYDKDYHFRFIETDHIGTLEPMRNGSKKPG